MFPRSPQGLKPLVNTPRDGTTEVVPSRTHQYRKLIFHRSHRGAEKIFFSVSPCLCG